MCAHAQPAFVLQVHSFEPVKVTHAMLQSNVQQNQLQNVVVLDKVQRVHCTQRQRWKCVLSRRLVSSRSVPVADAARRRDPLIRACARAHTHTQCTDQRFPLN
jgi:hypothetical protein